MNDDEAPTPKESGSLAIFESTCEEAITKLRGDDSERADDLRQQARDLIVVLRLWKAAAPAPEARAATVGAVMDLHRDVMEYLATR